MPQAPTRPDNRLIELLRGATQRVVRTADAMSDEQWRGSSLLPGWTRAHVVAHLTLNAEGLSASLRAVAESRSEPMYAGQQARDADITGLAAATPTELRSRFLASTTAFSDAVAAVPEEAWGIAVERVPGGTTFPAGTAPSMRLRELEVHHADLDLAYSPADWSDDFAVLLLEAMVGRGTPGDGLLLRADDLGLTWVCGRDDGPTVSGPAAALGWWLSGRGAGEGLTSDDGVLPRIEAW